jgi:uncharacterized membrane protein
MTLVPLLSASPVIQVHAYLAIAAIGLGAVQFSRMKGTRSHRAIGWIWVAVMMTVAGSSLFIHTIRTWGIWSPIHLLSVFTLAVVPLAVWLAARGDVEGHRRAMTQIFVWALVVTGLFTLWPGRIMHQVLFGT